MAHIVDINRDITVSLDFNYISTDKSFISKKKFCCKTILEFILKYTSRLDLASLEQTKIK